MFVLYMWSALLQRWLLMSFLPTLFGLQYILIVILLSMGFGEKMKNFVAISTRDVSEPYSLLPVWEHDSNIYHYIRLWLLYCLLSFNFCTKPKGYNICSYLLNGLPIAAGTTWEYRNDICVRFLFACSLSISSFWCLIEPVCHSDWYLVSVHRSEKYIAVAHFALALLNLSSSCSECSGKGFFSYCFYFFSGLRVI